uniref:Undecaprenyl-phosphate 4-deoxy-4-formamido-L-arabinose transferase n=1 Tax=Candidatus Methanophaga sp. ANME-1 ERB7 TaxID=2759913 RepID=A0A7G9Z4B4_9EURY|nr:undecaprenyl-phosphate 4-deoxy-4-formamido-L-arabinose transferase [Methanosarcinales archaeon ANME-1 ERB7]QNO55098.1 undecaprenyl-phosphate 4-deoxy-4-formamido-L-arabinose transferase [Methanosarcinales archaeon ANME-1 ERB7]
MPEVSVVIPSLDEEGTIGRCIEKVKQVFNENHIEGEVIIADNSTDKTAKIAKSLGATVITPERKGYGNAYLAGLSHAKGDFIVISDSDGTYDLSEMPKFLEPLIKGDADFVIGNRLGGNILKDAMPWHHRYIGNPILTNILNWLFKIEISDAHCGMRAFTKEAYEKMDLRTGGMEFASEMIIVGARKNLRIKEVPITYYPRISPSKLRSFSDGWRHLRFMMLYKPIHFLFIPGVLVFLLGVLLSLTILIRGNVETSHMHSLIFGSLLTIIGFQTIATGIYIKAYAAVHGVCEKEGFIKKLLDYHSLEKELIIGAALLLIGVAMGMKVVLTWISIGFGSLSEIENAVIAMLLAAIGIQVIFTAIFLSVLLLKEGDK